MMAAGVGVSAAAAQPASAAADPNCTGYGLDNLVDNEGPDYSAAYIKNLTTQKVVGVVQLCQRRVGEPGDPDWRLVRWAAVTLYYDMSSGQKANGRVVSLCCEAGAHHIEEVRSCMAPGGTGAIIGGTGDRTCASSGVVLRPDWWERADGAVYGTNGALIAYGSTSEYDAAAHPTRAGEQRRSISASNRMPAAR